MLNFFYKGRDPLSSYTHFIGMAFSVIGTILLIAINIINNNSIISLISCLIFGISMISLYAASTYYHYIIADATKIFKYRKLDHAMIYVLIAGTYTPVLLCFTPDNSGITFAIALWSIVFVAIILKLLWFNMPRWLCTAFYLALGWSILLKLDIFKAIPLTCTVLIVLGGILYSIGAIIYIIKKPNISKDFGFHEVFHVFIMLGTASHFASVLYFIV